MRRLTAILAIFLLVALAACNNQLNARPLSTPAPAIENPAAQPEAAETVQEEHKTAAEALKEFQEGTPATVPTGAKEGTTLYPPAPAGVTGEDALKARSHALYGTSKPVQLTGGAVTEFPDYTKQSSLPDNYGNSGSAGE